MPNGSYRRLDRLLTAMTDTDGTNMKGEQRT